MTLKRFSRPMLQPLKLKIEDVNDQTLIVSGPQDERWQLPRQAVYGQPTVGQDIRLVGFVGALNDLHATALAQALLNELLQADA